MSKCPTWVHCHGTSSGGGSGGGAAGIGLVVLCVAAAAVLRAVWSALMAVGAVIALALEIVALVVISTLGAAALGGIGYGVFAVRRRVLAARRQAPIQLTAERVAEAAATAPHMPVIEPKRPVSATGAHLWAVPDPADREGAKW